jgi:hypothetical protein
LSLAGLAAERIVMLIMLARMFGTAGDSSHDRLTDFSRPVEAAALTSLHEVAGPDADD